MKPLDLEFKQNGHTYTQIKRSAGAAMYAVGKCGSVEVIKIGHAKAHTWPNGSTSPERETYPNAEAFGASGWYYMPQQRQMAENRYMSLLETEPDDDHHERSDCEAERAQGLARGGLRL